MERTINVLAKDKETTDEIEVVFTYTNDGKTFEELMKELLKQVVLKI